MVQMPEFQDGENSLNWLHLIQLWSLVVFCLFFFLLYFIITDVFSFLVAEKLIILCPKYEKLCPLCMTGTQGGSLTPLWPSQENWLICCLATSGRDTNYGPQTVIVREALVEVELWCSHSGPLSRFTYLAIKRSLTEDIYIFRPPQLRIWAADRVPIVNTVASRIFLRPESYFHVSHQCWLICLPAARGYDEMKDNLREWSWDKRVLHVLISPTSLFQTNLTNNLEATSICCQAVSCFPSKKPQVACLFLRGRGSHPGIGAVSYSADCVSVTSVCF